MSTRLKSKKGFTLIELLVVISIIGILSSLSMVSVNIARQRARDAVRKADSAQVRLALYLYFDDNLTFPPANPEPLDAVDNWNNILVPALNGSDPAFYTYMLFVPTDPLNHDQYLYGYNTNLEGTEFWIRYYLEDGGPKDIHGY